MPTRPSASAWVNSPKRSNSGSIRPFHENCEAQTRACGSGSCGRAQTNSARSLPLRYANTPSGRSSASGASSPVSSCSSRRAAAAKLSPGSASPFGISQRGDRVAWPSSRRRPSVMITPQLVVFARILPYHAAGQAAVKPARRFLVGVAVMLSAAGDDEVGEEHQKSTARQRRRAGLLAVSENPLTMPRPRSTRDKVIL